MQNAKVMNFQFYLFNRHLQLEEYVKSESNFYGVTFMFKNEEKAIPADQDEIISE